MKKSILITNVLVIFAILLVACSNPTSPQVQPISPSGNSQPVVPTDTPQPSMPTETETSPASATPKPSQTIVAVSPTQTETPLPTFPLELTQTPGIQMTATAYAATATAYQMSLSAIFGPMADMMNIGQYFNPVGTPATSWHDIPIMAQATTGQEFKADIYSYKATATLSTAAKFYNNQVKILNWACNPMVSGTAGAGSNAQHDMVLTCYKGFVVDMTSFDNDISHVIVVLNKAP